MKLLKYIFFVLIFILLNNISKADKYQIKHVEPPFWWIGMHQPKLQILVHGENISALHPKIDYAGVRLEKIIRTENPNYLFIDLIIDEKTKAGSFDINFTKDSKIIKKHTYQLLAREENSANREGYNSSDVMYLITPDRFANGNPDNDNIEGLIDKANRADYNGRHGGDIQGVIDNLDYIADMGFTALWLNPILENNMDKTSYHGYAITDFYKTDARYGSNHENKKMVNLAKQKGVKFIMDVIFNHCGSSHWWMSDMPTSDWINFGGKYTYCNHRRTTVQDPYCSKSDSKYFSDGWFWEGMPDLNQKNPLMANYLTQNTIWWVEYLGLAGIRVDTYPYPDKDFMSAWTCRIMDEYPDFNIVGEEWSENPAIVSHWQRGKTNKNGHTSCLPGLMDFPINFSVRDALSASDDDRDNKLTKLYEMLANDFLYSEPENLVIFPDNHDMSRFYTQINENFDMYKIGIAYYLTMRGIPQIFYGTEILMTNPNSAEHGIIRSDFPGGWKDDKVNAITGQGLTAQQKEAQSYMKQILNWRKNAEVIHSGKLMHYAPENGIYVYFRYTDKNKVMVVLNFDNKDKTLNTKRFSEMLEGYSTGTDILTNKSFEINNEIKVAAGTPLIISVKLK